MSALWAAVNRHFGQGARVSWFDRSYLVDWLVVGALWFLSGMIKVSPVFERKFKQSDDDIHFPHRKNQIGGLMNNSIALFVPLIVVVIVGTLRRSLFVIHHGAIGILATRGLSQVITEFLKHSVGRLRPDFLARCKWDKVIKECTGKASTILDGRKSFPSGHSSTAFSGMVFLALFIAGQTAAWSFGVPKSPRSMFSSRMATFAATLLPIFWAMHVALTRIQDYRHHKEDVIVGSIIGIFSATVCYFVFWPNPFTKVAFEIQNHGQPRLLYTEGEQQYSSMGAADFELNRFEGEESRV